MTDLAALTVQLAARHDLATAVAAGAATSLASAGTGTEAKAAFLIALATKGETATELAAFATTFRSLAVDPGLADWAPRAIDIVGTGGDHSGGFNISSLVVLVLASAGVPVMKHVNRGITSKCGSADLFAALGVDLTATPAKLRQAMTELGYVFFFAPNYHPAFQHIAPVRKALAAQGQRTIFNSLGPLLNPGRPAHALAGVFSERWVPRLAEALGSVGVQAGLAVHGVIDADHGIDELTTATVNRVRGFGRMAGIDGSWRAEDFDLRPAPFAELVGGDLAANLALIDALLDGRGPGRTGRYDCAQRRSRALDLRPHGGREGRSCARARAAARRCRAGKNRGNPGVLSPMNRQYFGTDGVRGPYGGSVINEAFAARLGAAAACWLRDESAAETNKVVIGRDTRFSGPSLETAIAAGLRHEGAAPVSLGVVPTPAVSRAVRALNAALGVVITASHNPAEDNGIKFFGLHGQKLTDDEEARLEQLIPLAVPSSGSVPVPVVDTLIPYLAMVQSILPPNALRDWRIVLDTANGATCATSPVVLHSLGAILVQLGHSPDGRNINDGVGSEHPQSLVAQVRATGARLGVAHDGDGDRCILSDECGVVLDGDEILTILATHALIHGSLKEKTLVVTVQSNLGVDEAVRAAGGRVVRTPVGDRYVGEYMRAAGACLGGESSGHILCGEVSPTGDGLVAALKVMEVMLTTGRPLSELRRVLKRFPQATANLSVREKRPLETLRGLGEAIAVLEAELGDHGRVLVRWSGTEAKLRFLVENTDETVAKNGLERLLQAAKNELG